MSTRTERWTALDPLRERSRLTIVPEDGGAPHTIDYTFADGVTEVRQSWTDEVQTDKFSQADYENVRGELSPGQPGADPVAGVRKLLADGELKAAGEETLDGRRVLRLTGEEPSPNGTAERPFPRGRSSTSSTRRPSLRCGSPTRTSSRTAARSAACAGCSRSRSSSGCR